MRLDRSDVHDDVDELLVVQVHLVLVLVVHLGEHAGHDVQQNADVHEVVELDAAIVDQLELVADERVELLAQTIAHVVQQLVQLWLRYLAGSVHISLRGKRKSG